MTRGSSPLPVPPSLPRAADDSSQLELQPGVALGPFRLGLTLHALLSYLRREARRWPRVEVTAGPTDAPPAPVMVALSLPDGATLHLAFETTSQRLQTAALHLPSASGSAPSAPLARYRGAPLPPLTRAAIQRIWGPTYPMRQHVRTHALLADEPSGSKEGSAVEHLLCYPGVAFGFEDPTQVARTVYLFRGLDPHAPEPAPPLHPSESQPPAITSARVKPGSSVQLTFSSGDEVELVLGHSTAQDVLADLGAPESRWHRDDQRLGIHFGPHEADEPSHDTDAAGIFHNYPSLGLDVLLERSQDQDSSVVSKVVLHSNSPGTALFGRYERVPWRIAASSDQSEVTYADSLVQLHKRLRPQGAGKWEHGGTVDGGPEAEAQRCPDIMELDRGADPELQRLRLDVRSRLIGFPGVVVEVGPGDRVSAVVLVPS